MSRKVALLIGVGQYAEDSGLQSLQCPMNSVSAVESLLRDVNIGGFDNVIALPNPDVGTARSRLGDVFSSLAKDDLALFYFTGHGIKDMTGDFYLTTAATQLFADGRLNPGTALEADFIRRVMGNSYAQRKVIILDCCFAAAFAEGFLTMDDGTVDVGTQLGGEGWVVLTAATSRNYALEQTGEPLSVYTRYLVEGLKTGTAAPEGQDYISVGDLHNYVKAKVKTAAPTMEPAIFTGHQGSDIVLARATIGDSERRYRKELEAKICQGQIRPAARTYLDIRRSQLDLTAKRAQALEDEVLQPYREKQQHIDRYKAALSDEIAYAFPLDAEATKELRALQKFLNLTDDDLRPAIATTLHNTQPTLDPAPLANSLLSDPPVGWAPRTTLPAPPATSPPPQEPARTPPAVPQPNRPERVESPPSHPTFEFEIATISIGKGLLGRGQPKLNITRRRAKAEYFREDLGNGITLDLVRIPAGQFLMGSPNSEENRSDDEDPPAPGRRARVLAGQIPYHPGPVPGHHGREPQLLYREWSHLPGRASLLARCRGLLPKALSADGAHLSPAYRSRMGICLSSGHDHPLSPWANNHNRLSQLRWQLHLWQRPKGHLSKANHCGRRFSAQCLWPVRHARQPVGMVRRPLAPQLRRGTHRR